MSSFKGFLWPYSVVYNQSSTASLRIGAARQLKMLTLRRALVPCAAPRVAMAPVRLAPAVLRTREVRVMWSKRDETLANWEQLRSNPDEW